MKPIKSLSTLLTTIVMMSAMLLAPVAVPIIIPRATLHAVFGCQSQTTGTVSVMDGHGHTYTLSCATNLTTGLGYPGQFPSEDKPWLVIISAQPGPGRLAMPCLFKVMRAPVHVQCAANSDRPVTVDFDLILTLDIGG